MKRIYVYTKEHGVIMLKVGVSFLQYKTEHPEAIIVHPPSRRTMRNWDTTARALDGCRVEFDGTCPHGFQSWLLHYGVI